MAATRRAGEWSPAAPPEGALGECTTVRGPMDYTETSLFQRTLAEPRGRDKDAAPRKRLRDALSGLRERAAVLAGEIDRDLPGLTVHDITHLDALWEMADLIAGPDYPLNPLEAFTLGGAFLLHDLGLGLAAWPGGRAELQTGAGWQDALSAHLRKQLGRTPTPEELASPPPEVEHLATEERLRLLHAERAEHLAFATWSDPKGGTTYQLIDDPDFRQALGPLLGRIAHSHWWPVSRLSSEFGTVIGALPDCPTSWTIDPVKVAALLRTADAAHLDARRAPGFLRALRRPEGISRDHWLFQEHLLKPRLDAERLAYTTARPFPIEEVNAWWLCEETLRMVDSELHQIDSLLADLKLPRLRVRGVAGVDSPGRLRKYVEVAGWSPVDARIHVSNVADVVRRLGGEQLYGRNPLVPLRELIQNASDAVRARRILEERPANWGCVTVRLEQDDQGWWLEVEDTGIGMSEAVLTGPLLDFGATYWGSALMREEHEGLWAKGFKSTGRFGIGFFSVFMWGHSVSLTTRPYREGQRDTRVLEFQTGLETRPLLRPARTEEQLLDAGTRVRVWLKTEPYQDGGLLMPWPKYYDRKAPEELGELCAWLAPALDVDLYVDEKKRGIRRVVAASDWLTLDGPELLTRLTLFVEVRQEVRAWGSFVRVIGDSTGAILGRASILGTHVSLRMRPGVITVGGLRASEVAGLAGVVVGSAESAARDRASPLASDDERMSWASKQAELIATSISDSRLRLTCASWVLAFGGDPGELPIALRGQEFVNREALERWNDAPDEIILLRLGELEVTGGAYELYPHVLCIDEVPLDRALARAARPRDAIKQALARAWNCSPDEISISQDSQARAVGRWSGFPYKPSSIMIIRKPRPGT